MIRQNDKQAGPETGMVAKQRPRPYVIAGLAVIVLLLGSLVAWSMTAKIGGAVIASGKLAVESKRKTVEHLDGGIVGALLVRDGDRVGAGQLLLRLDDTLEKANLAVVVNQLDELRARAARLRAELKGEETVVFRTVLMERQDDPTVAEILQGERALFEARKASRDSRLQILEQRIAGFRDQIKGLEDQQAARERQMALTRQELEVVEKLLKKGLAPLTRALDLKSRLQQLSAQRAEHATEIAQAQNEIGEIRLQMTDDAQGFREEVTGELRDVQARIFSLAERHVAAEARLSRLDIVAPQAGVILDLKVHTIGGVIRAGEPILDIVPEEDELILEALVQPKDIDKVETGLRSKIRLSAFDQQTTPEILGTLTSISADRLEDPREGVPFFIAQIRIDNEEKEKLGDLRLVPGMPAEVFIQTGERLAISYFLKPLVDNLSRAFKDG